jgi:tetratricopeptide (TPR) repeat protein
VPRDLDALASWLQQEAAPAPVRVEPTEAAGFAGLTGPTPCRGLDPSRLRVEGVPPALRSVRPTALAADKAAAGRTHFAAGRFPEARADWQVADRAEAAPLPAAALAVAASYAEEGRWQESLAVYQDVAGRFPWNPEAHAGIGRSLRALARRIEAIEAWSHALALWPRSPQLRAQVAGDAFAEWHPPLGPPAARIERDGRVRWVQLAGPERDPLSPHVLAEATAYATCKEAFRASAALRRAATGRDLPTWLWTPAEESVCAGAWLRIYLQNRGRGRGAEDGLETLVEIAREGYLDERALADVGAWIHEAAPLLLEAPRRRRLFAFVEKYRVAPRRDAGWLFP